MSKPSQNLDIICKTFHDHFGGNLTHLVKILTKKTQLKRRKIQEMYMEMYGQDLFDDLQHGDHGVIPLAMLVLNPHERDAIAARDAIYKRSEINYKVLVEIYAGRKSSHFFLIQQVYQMRYGRYLDQDILAIEPPHPYQKILMGLGASQRAHSECVSQHIANCDAQRLFQTGEGGRGSGSKSIDESVVLEILTKRSISQLRLTFFNYNRIYGHNYTKGLKNYCGEFVDALRVVADFILNPSKHYAKSITSDCTTVKMMCYLGKERLLLEAIYESFREVTKDNEELALVMMSRAKVDEDEIKRVFNNKYGKELKCAIVDGSLTRDYKDFLLPWPQKKKFLF